MYKKELKGQFLDTVETLQILEEDKLKDGSIAPRVTELYKMNAWSTIDWTCQECQIPQSFPNILDLNDHLHKVHRMKYRRNCYDCTKRFPHFAGYLNHIIESHTSESKFCCILCKEPEYRWNLKDLYTHYRKKHKNRRIFLCLYCGLHFICGAKLKEHLIVKHKRENDEGGRFECDFCGWKTELRHRMKTHMVKHVSQSMFMCDQCTVTFASSCKLFLF